MDRITTIFVLLAAAVIAIATGCCGSPGRSDVIGTYRLHPTGRVDSLELRDDGVYIHRFDAGGGVEQQEGVWSWRKAPDDKWALRLDAFRCYWDDDLGGATAGLNLTPERDWRGDVQLPVDYDRGLYYLKDG